MAGAMRKMGVYLGLVEDDDRHEVAEYEEYDEYAEAEVVPVRRVVAGRGWEDAEPRAAMPAPNGGSREPAYRDVGEAPGSHRSPTLHPRSGSEARASGELSSLDEMRAVSAASFEPVHYEPAKELLDA